MQESIDTIDKIRVASARSLTRLVSNVLEISRAEIEALNSRHTANGLPPIAERTPAILQRFKQRLYEYFGLLNTVQQAALGVASDAALSELSLDQDSADVSLLDHDYIEAMIAMNSMIINMRRHPIPGMGEFQTRLQQLYPDIEINTSNNPLDPEQIGECFNFAIRPLGLRAHLLLVIYREFDKIVFASLGGVVEEVNRLLAVTEELSHANSVASPADPSDSEPFTSASGEYVETAQSAPEISSTPSPAISSTLSSNTELPADVDAFVTEKIQEHIFEIELDPAIRTLLDTHFHNALLKILHSEGTESKSWAATMQTIDMMLWTVQADKQDGDEKRLAKIRQALADKLESILQFSGASRTKSNRALRQLKQIQDYSFLKAATQSRKSSSRILMSDQEPPALPADDANRLRVIGLPLGTCFEFTGVDGQTVRARLAAKIDSIEKCLFTDQGSTKLLELSYDRLATALKKNRIVLLTDPGE